MSTETRPAAARRIPLSRDKVLRAAMTIADEGGLETLTMRTLGQELGVGPMALYRHAKNKDDLVDGIVDLVFSEIDVPDPGVAWRIAMRQRAISVREVLSRHRWAVALMESRTNPGPANLRHHDAVIGNLRASGFDMAMAAHAYSLLDSYIYGFALTKMNLPFESTADIAEMAQTMLEPFSRQRVPQPRGLHHRARHEARLRLRGRVRVRPRSHPRRPREGGRGRRPAGSGGWPKLTPSKPRQWPGGTDREDAAPRARPPITRNEELNLHGNASRMSLSTRRTAPQWAIESTGDLCPGRGRATAVRPPTQTPRAVGRIRFTVF